MPELPEVESIRRSVAPLIVGQPVLSATLHRRDVLIAPGDPQGGFSRQRGTHTPSPTRLGPGDLLQGTTITDVARHGKQLALIAQPDRPGAHPVALGIQLGMTGNLLFASDPAASPHTHARWRFPGGTLIFQDPRRFGSLRVFRSLDDLHAHWRALGPDALGITTPQLAAALHTAKRHVKAALLDQSLLAGVGNIYADEALHMARIAPKRRGSTLTHADVAALAKAIRTTLSRAIRANGSTLRDYQNARGEPGGYQSQHAVYGRAGQPCRTCQTLLKTGIIAQRTTVWCPSCQH